MYNKYAFNPAYGGMDGSLSIYAQARNQWSNLALSPTTYMINGHMPIYGLNGAVGIKLNMDKIGYTKSQSVSASYNYVLTRKSYLLSAGAGVGYRQLGIDGAKLITPEGEYNQTVNHKDPILSEAYNRSTGIVWDLGIAFIMQDFEAAMSISSVGINTLNNKLYTTYTNPNFNVFFQYNIYLSKGFVIKPLALFTTDFVGSNIDLSTVIEYYGNIFAGISVQMDNKIKIGSFGITTGSRINQNIKVYYSYDIGLSGLRTLHDGTHEIVINYNLNKIIGKGGNLPIIYSPRNL